MYKKYDIALIGSSGFIAEALIQQFYGKKTILHIGRNKPSQCDPTDFITYDLNTDVQLTNKFQIDTVIFNAAIKGRFADNSEAWTNQGKVTAPNFRDLFARLNLDVSRLITMGSSEEYGARDNDTPIREDDPLTPLSSYGSWKVRLHAENLKWSRQFNKPAIHLRPFNIFGTGLDKNMFLGSLITTLLQNKSFPMTLGEQHRSFVPVNIVNETIHKLLTLESWDAYQRNGALNVSSHHYYRIIDVAHIICNLVKSGQLEVGKLAYRQEEVWHQNPDLTLIDKLLGQDINYDFTNEMTYLIQRLRSDF
ncbi:MAG: NAD(P)-dependent oxidoreductase [Bdellovibrionota bacterium]